MGGMSSKKSLHELVGMGWEGLQRNKLLENTKAFFPSRCLCSAQEIREKGSWRNSFTKDSERHSCKSTQDTEGGGRDSFFHTDTEQPGPCPQAHMSSEDRCFGKARPLAWTSALSAGPWSRAGAVPSHNIPGSSQQHQGWS